MPVTRVLFMLVALLSIGYLGAFVGSILWYLIVRFIAYVPVWALTFPLFFALAGLFGWAFGRWPDGPPHREMIIACVLDVPASMLLAYLLGGTAILQAALWAAGLAGLFYVAALLGLARRGAATPERRERTAPTF